MRPVGIIFTILLTLTGVARAEQPAQNAQLCLNIAGHTAPVMTMAFSSNSTLLTAGLDKTVHVWRLPERLADSTEAAAKAALTDELWSQERTIRWSIGRGQRGSIYALAVQPKTGELAIAGYGARGALGDIALVDPADGTVLKVLEEHRESVMSLAFSASGKSLISIDRGGRLLLWPTDGGKPKTLCNSDADVHGPDAAQAIAAALRLRPIAVAGDRWVAAPVYAGLADDKKTMTWQVQLYNLADGQPAEKLKTIHYGTITALACSANARYVVSADQARQLSVWDTEKASVEQLPTSLPVVSLAIAPQGDVLAAGTASDENTGSSELQIWDLASGQLRRKQTLNEPVYACAISPDGQKLAYVGGQGHDVLVEKLNAPEQRLRIAGGRQITAVGIMGTTATYRIVYDTLPEPSGATKSRTFDPQKLEITPWAAPVPQAPMTIGRWQAVLDRKNNRLSLFADGASIGTLETDRQHQGLIYSFCWIVGGNGSPLAFAIGTNIQCGVYVYGMPKAGEFPLLRYFRGHYDLVSALSASADGRILVSGSRDGTIRCWPLGDLLDPATIYRRWGAELVEQNGQATVAAINEYGPLYQKQVRAGDAITKIMWLDGQTARSEQRPKELLQRLAELPWHAQVSFFTSRKGAERAPFNLVGGWHQWLGLYTTQRDWIAWTPSGYYACSAGGEQLIGWQVNNDDLRQTPAFYPAETFNKALYRPDVIRSLLAEGTVNAAIQRQHETPTHVNEIPPPAVKIVFAQQQPFDEHTTRMRIAATAESKDEHPLVAMQLMLDGRPYGDSRLYAADDPAGRKRKEDWTIELTPGQHRIAVQAEGARSYASDELDVQCAGQADVKPALYCLSVGLSDYPGQLRLRYGHSDAKALASVLEHNSTELFRKVEVKTLVDAQATKQSIDAGLQWLQQSATWRDVSVFFYAGHGLNDQTGQFFLLPIDGAVDHPDRTCVSEARLREFCQQTHGKIMVLLDACRSASIKINVNELALKLGRNDCGAIVLTSSAGYQQSFEGDQWKAGAFTRALVDGLEGRADMFRTGYVSSPYDIACYVDHVVRSLTDEHQTPICATPKMPQFRLTRATVH